LSLTGYHSGINKLTTQSVTQSRILLLDGNLRVDTKENNHLNYPPYP